MSTDAASIELAPKARLEPMPRPRVLLLGTALLGSLLVSLSGQFVSSNLPDIQGGTGASADEASWLTTAYSMALLAGIVCSSPLIATVGLRRYVTACALMFAGAAAACAAAPPMPIMIAFRALQGFAAGGFGPAAFAATFVTMAGPRLPFGLSLLALFLLLPSTIGPAASGLIEDQLGWEALFLVQAAVGSALAMAAIFFMPPAPISPAALRRDWTALLLLSVALAATLLVMGQGTRRYWLDSALVAWVIAIAVGTWAAFLFTVRRSPLPVLRLELLRQRSFAAAMTLNLLFRTGFATTAFLIPQFLVIIQGYRPLETGRLFLWAAIPQLLVYPLTWWLMKRIEGRLIMGSGLILFGLGALLAANSTSLAAADQFRAALGLAAAGQVLFLVPILVAGGAGLEAEDGPTASLMFNATTVGGTNLGIALATELVTERQKFHMGALAESAAAYGTNLYRLEPLTGSLASRGDDALTSARAAATLAGTLRREAWVLSFNDGFLLVAALLIASAAGLLLLRRQPPLGARVPNAGGSS